MFGLQLQLRINRLAPLRPQNAEHTTARLTIYQNALANALQSTSAVVQLKQRPIFKTAQNAKPTSAGPAIAEFTLQ
jgi:hypothetical protein